MCIIENFPTYDFICKHWKQRKKRLYGRPIRKFELVRKRDNVSLGSAFARLIQREKFINRPIDRGIVEEKETRENFSTE